MSKGAQPPWPPLAGIGRDKGEYALENYTQVKAVYQSLDDGQAWR